MISAPKSVSAAPLSSGALGVDFARTVKWPKGLVFPISEQGPVDYPRGETARVKLGGVGRATGEVSPALCFRHQRILLRLMEQIGPFGGADKTPISFNSLLKGERGAKKRKLLRRTMDEISRSLMHSLETDGRSWTTTEILTLREKSKTLPGFSASDDRVREDETKIAWTTYDWLQFNEHFLRLFTDFKSCHDVRVDVVENLDSDLVAAIYLSITPDAFHPDRSSDDPLLIDAAKLLKRVGAKVPQYQSKLLDCFHRRRNASGTSTLEQLNGLSSWGGRLVVEPELRPNRDSSGFNLACWGVRTVEQAIAQTTARPSGELVSIWTHSGLDESSFVRAQDRRERQLTDYDRELLRTAGYPIEKNIRFLELVRSIIGGQAFSEELADVKSVLLEKPDSITKGIGAYLGGRLTKQVEAVAFREARRRKTA